MNCLESLIKPFEDKASLRDLLLYLSNWRSLNRQLIKRTPDEVAKEMLERRSGKVNPYSTFSVAVNSGCDPTLLRLILDILERAGNNGDQLTKACRERTKVYYVLTSFITRKSAEEIDIIRRVASRAPDLISKRIKLSWLTSEEQSALEKAKLISDTDKSFLPVYLMLRKMSDDDYEDSENPVEIVGSSTTAEAARVESAKKKGEIIDVDAMDETDSDDAVEIAGAITGAEAARNRVEEAEKKGEVVDVDVDSLEDGNKSDSDERPKKKARKNTGNGGGDAGELKFSLV